MVNTENGPGSRSSPGRGSPNIVPAGCAHSARSGLYSAAARVGVHWRTAL